jgi:hypothetical protein
LPFAYSSGKLGDWQPVAEIDTMKPALVYELPRKS